MEQELTKHRQEKDAKILWNDIKKEFAQTGLQFSGLNGLRRRFNKGKKLAGKYWAREYCKRYGLAARSPEWCSKGRIIGFNRMQCQSFLFQ
jgi:hypothetical protein